MKLTQPIGPTLGGQKPKGRKNVEVGKSMKKYEIRTLPNTTHKDKLKMD